MERLMRLIKHFPRASRMPFLIGSLIPAALGTALAFREAGLFDLTRFLLTLTGISAAHLSVNFFNDYFDHRYGADSCHPPRPLSGGSQVLQEGLETPVEILTQALLCAAAALGAALFLALLAVPPGIFFFAALGGLLGYFYSARPLILSWRGLGELTTGLCFGPLVVAGSYFVQASYISHGSLLLSLVPGVLITAVLYVNQYPDYDDDRLAGKKTLVVRLGPRRSVYLLYPLLLTGFIPLIPGPWSTLAPPFPVALAGFIPAAAAAALLSVNKGEAGPGNRPGKLMLISYTLTLILLVAGVSLI